MGAVFKLFAAVLILVNCAKDGDDLFIGGERDRAGNRRAVALCDFDDLFRSLVDKGVIVGFEPDSDLVFLCHGFGASKYNNEMIWLRALDTAPGVPQNTLKKCPKPAPD